MARVKSDTIESMGLEAFLIAHYGPDSYRIYVELLTAGKSDSDIARAFSTEHRKINYQTPSTWRRAYNETKV